MFWHYSREGKHGVRAWLHFGQRSCFHTEVNWWTNFCHASISNDDEGWTISLALPPLAIWLVFDAPWLWLPKKLAHFTWENPSRDVWLPEGRRCEVSIHDWTIHIYPWSKTMEWCKADLIAAVETGRPRPETVHCRGAALTSWAARLKGTDVRH